MLPNEDKVREWLLNAVTTHAIVVHSLTEAEQLWDIVRPFVGNDDTGMPTFFNYSKKRVRIFQTAPRRAEVERTDKLQRGFETLFIKVLSSHSR